MWVVGVIDFVSIGVDLVLLLVSGFFLLGSLKDMETAWFPLVNLIASILTLCSVTFPRAISFLVFACAKESQKKARMLKILRIITMFLYFLIGTTMTILLIVYWCVLDIYPMAVICGLLGCALQSLVCSVNSCFLRSITLYHKYGAEAFTIVQPV